MGEEIQITVTMERVPDGDGPEFDAWCEAWKCRPLGGGRRAWCGDAFGAYIWDAVGVAWTKGGGAFLLYPEDLSDG